MIEYGKDLNPEQLDAVLHKNGPLLVFAGAGSGKTRVITYRIANLISNSRVNSYNILAVTFTNKAAREMKERINKILDSSAKGISIGTFHSIGARILRSHAELLGLKSNFTIYDEGDKLTQIKKIQKVLQISEKEINPKSIINIMEKAKNDGVSPEDAPLEVPNWIQDKVLSIIQKYNSSMKLNNAVDFGDLLLLPLILFEKHPEVKDKFCRYWKYILVDEFQDTNRAQYRLIKHLSEESQNICVVGDDDQSIYKWRGADIGNILSFEQDFKNTKVIHLEQNYRSTKKILNAAYEIVCKIPERIEKKLWTENEDGKSISCFVANDELKEAEWIVNSIDELKKTGYKYNNFAVFYRTHAQSRVIEESFRINRIPHIIFGGMRFYERREVKDLMSYIKLVSNPDNNQDFTRALSNPPRGIGETSIKKLENIAQNKNCSLTTLLNDTEDNLLKPKQQKSLIKFKILIERSRKQINSITPSEIAQNLLEGSGMIEHFESQKTDESYSRLENLKELISAIQQYELSVEEPTLSEFVEISSLSTNLDTEESSKNFVTLMTLHTAKGLEFPVVYMTGMEENIFPHIRHKEELGGLEEERRLCYVGMTRSMKKLNISCAKSRSLYGRRDYQTPSRFINEIPAELLEIQGQDSIHSSHTFESNHSNYSNYQNNDYQFSEKTYSNNFKTTKNMNQNKIPGTQNEGLDNIFSKGRKVQHTSFGTGKVISSSGKGLDAKLTVSFPGFGTKKVIAKFVTIK